MDKAQQRKGREVMRRETTYEQGVAYAEKVGRTMSRERRLENVRYVMSTSYVGKASPTRAYWLGFARTLRGMG